MTRPMPVVSEVERKARIRRCLKTAARFQALRLIAPCLAALVLTVSLKLCVADAAAARPYEAFYTIIQRDHRLLQRRYITRDFQAVSPDGAPVVVDLERLGVSGLTLRSAALSPNGRWLAVGLTMDGAKRTLLILRVATGEAVYCLTEEEGESHRWFAWTGGDSLRFFRAAESAPDGTLRYLVYALNGPLWRGTEKRLAERPVEEPPFLLPEYRTREARGEWAAKWLSRLGYSIPSLGAYPEGAQPTSWKPYLIDPMGRYGSASDDRKWIAALVYDRHKQGNHLVLLDGVRRWEEHELLPVTKVRIWTTKFWADRLVVGTADPGTDRDGTVSGGGGLYQNRRLLFFPVRRPENPVVVMGDLFVPVTD